MFGIDFSEILVIFGIALVVLGPEKLPRLAATIGRWIGRARNMARQFRDQLEQEANALNRDLELRERETAARKSAAAQPEPPAPAAPNPPETPATPAPSETVPWIANGAALEPPALDSAMPAAATSDVSAPFATPPQDQAVAVPAQAHERGQ
ncbi:MAG: Sec-independent protein translocase protein TatB [Steroidobacteraceae bacterium]|jgi:sec-independent protein translocase protein TatB